MSFRSLLVPLFGVEQDRAALNAAFAVARDFDAHVDALFAHPDPRDAVPVLGDGVSGTVIEEIMRAAEEDSDRCRASARLQFDEAVGDAGIQISELPPVEDEVTARWLERRSRPEELIPQESRLRDLTIFGAAPQNDEGVIEAAIENTLMNSGRPLLYVSDAPPDEIGRSVAIAWNGKPEAARAVAAAMPFLESAESVRILTAETTTIESDVGRRLIEYLAWHRVFASLVTVTPGAVPAGKALADKATEIGADLLVMGGYGHSRMREMILGGVTRYILAHPGLPVLLAH